MTINICPDALKFVAEVDELGGIPTPQDPQQNEYFGPYLNKADWKFLTYDAATRQWGMVPSSNRREPFPPTLVRDPDLSDEEIESLQDAMMIGDTMHLPPDPTDVTRAVSQPPFIYMGWRLAWLFLPQLKRWEIASLGRA